MNPGPELDVLVAEKVMGLIVKESTGWSRLVCAEREEDFGESDTFDSISGSVTLPRERPLPNYSTEISAAWAVVEKMYETWEVQLRLFMRAENFRSYECSFVKCDGGFYMGHHFNIIRTADKAEDFKPECGYHNARVSCPTPYTSDSMPHAICLAALKAVEEK